MKLCKLIFIIIALLLSTQTVQAAATTRDTPTHPTETQPRPKLQIDPTKTDVTINPALWLPKTLVIYNFTITNVTYSPGSTMNNATGNGTASFGDNSPSFPVPFNNLKITGSQTLGRVIDGQIIINFQNRIKVTLGTMTGLVSKLFLKGTSNPNVGNDQVTIDLLLPTLWTRAKVGNGYTPAKQAYLKIKDLETTQDLDIFLTDYQAHGLGEVGIGDTGIIMDCADRPLTVDLSTKQPVNNYPALTGVVFPNIKTLSRPELANTNIGYCYGEYLLQGGLSNNGLFAKLILQKPWSFQTSVPQGFQIALQAGDSLHPSGYQVNSNVSAGNETTLQANITLLQDADTTSSEQGLPINPNSNSKSGNTPQQQLEPVYSSTLTLAKSAVLKGSLTAKITPPVINDHNNNPIIFNAFGLLVDSNLDLSGNLVYHQPIYWGKCQNQQETSFALQSDQPAHCFFPGAAQVKMEFTKLQGGQEIFKDFSDLTKLPGITLTSFNLTIRTNDANGKAIYLGFEDEFEKKQNSIYKIAPVPQTTDLKPQQLWLNIGAAGISGKINIEAKLAYDNSNSALPSLPIELGNPNPYDSNLVLLGNYAPFKGYLHSNAWITKTESDGRPTPQSWNETARYFGPFFEATFVDSAVFNLEIDGHFYVDGPSNIYPLINNLSSTSTADLTSGTVTVDATLDYWGVDLHTKNSSLVPKVTQVFFLGAAIEELKHYSNGFPIVWGEMTPDGNIPELLFGYAYQEFDHLSFSYRLVQLSPWIKNKTGYIKGSLDAEGDLFFPYFDFQKMLILDSKDVTPNLDPKYEGRKVEVRIDKGNNYTQFANTFAVKKSWGPVKNNQATAVFNYPAVGYNDGPEAEDGFAQFYLPNQPGNGEVTLRDFSGALPGSIQITGLNGAKAKITIPDQATTHGLIGNLSGNHLRTPDNEPILFTSDTLPEFKLNGQFKGEIMGGCSGDYEIGVRPECSTFIVNYQNKTTANFGLNFGAANVSGVANLSVTYRDQLFSGDITFENLNFSAGIVSGHGNGGFGVTIDPGSKYIQGYGTITINGIPWPAPNSGGGAFFLGYNANPANIYTLDYINREGLGVLGDIVTGFYLACKIGYDYDLGFLGGASFYMEGGAGLFNSTALFQAGLSAEIEVCEVGLSSSTGFNVTTNINNITNASLTGYLHYSLSLLFFEFEWGGSITLNDGGAAI